jgi:hypothetical protein
MCEMDLARPLPEPHGTMPVIDTRFQVRGKKWTDTYIDLKFFARVRLEGSAHLPYKL